ncbi:MAG: glycosyltransferase, partial [Microthrixaceae bacterium]
GDLQEVPHGVEIDHGLVGSTERSARLRAAAAPRAAALLPLESVRAECLRHPSAALKVVLAVGHHELVRRWATRLDTPDVVYTYWLGAATAALRAAWPMVPIVSRVHGGDLFWERHGPPVIPFQQTAIDAADAVASVSAEGARYLMRRYPRAADRIVVRRLGTENPGRIAPASSDGVVRLVSVSSLTEVKRPLLLAEVVCRVAEARPAVTWRHYGSGTLLDGVERVLERSAPTSLSAELVGFVDHDQVLRELTSGPWDAFLNVSASEGVPVSLMEAQSVGLPVVASDVGGTSEVVDVRVDELVDPGSTPEDIARAVLRAVDSAPERRHQRHEIWADRYDAARNYREFAQWLRSFVADHDSGS